MKKVHASHIRDNTSIDSYMQTISIKKQTHKLIQRIKPININTFIDTKTT